MLGGNNKSGFTLIETLVVLGVFTLLTVLIINVFLLSLQSQRHASARQEAISNLRFAIESIAHEVRTKEINYDQPIDDQTLNLRLGDSDMVTYSLNSFGEIEVNTNGQVATLNDANEIVVFELQFLVDPPNDPYAEERCNVNADCVSDSCTVNEPGDKDFKSGFCNCTDTVAASDCSPVVGNCTADVNRPGVNLCLPFDRQPRVTIAVAFQPILKSGRQETVPVYMQTTISSRVYKR